MFFKLLNSLANEIMKKKYAKNLIRKKSKILRFTRTTVPQSKDSPFIHYFKGPINIKLMGTKVVLHKGN